MHVIYKFIEYMNINYDSLLLEVCVAIIIVLIIVILFYKIAKLKLSLGFVQDNHDKLLEQLQQLNNEKIDHIKEIQDLKTRIEFVKLENQKSEQANEDALKVAKSSLVDLGNNLSKQLIELHKQETAESRKLSEDNIYNTSLKFQQEFQKLLEIVAVLNSKVDESTKTVEVIKSSLLSPSSVGALAEITLENILKASGLRAKYDFVMQCNLTIEHNTRLRPDVLIFLPGDNLMIIDAKASKFLLDINLSHSSNDNKMKVEGLKKTMNTHLKSLSSKDYAQTVIDSNEFRNRSFNNIITLMFLPSESAIENLISMDKEFIHKSWELNIFPVGPSGLMNMLSFAKFQIKEQMRYENQRLILSEVEKIISSISSLTEHACKLGNSINNIVSSYDQFAASFNRNFLSKTRLIRQLGIDTKRTKNNNNQSTLARYQLITTNTEIDMADNKIENS